ncbi:MAG: Gfo/Idh/MocA family protein [Pseudomonadota bacterium]
MTDEIRYGVIGTGMMGCEHIRNIAAIDGARVTALADPNERPRHWGLKSCPEDRQPEVFADYRDLLAADLCDVVVIASPNFTHRDVLDAVFETDLHVMVEKPMCTTMADCRHVVERARLHKGIFWVGLEYRYMPPTNAFLRELAAGAVGNLKMLSIREHRFPFLVKVDNWNRFSRNTGGTLVEKCCHFFDLMNLATGSEAVSVFASGGQDVNHLDEVYDGEVPDILDNAYVIVEYANGCRAHLDLCMFAESSRDEQEICAVGDTGKLEIRIPSAVMTKGVRATREIEESRVPENPAIRFQGLHHGASYLEHLDLIEAITSGGQAKVTALDGLRSVAIGVAAHRAIEEKRVVQMNEI